MLADSLEEIRFGVRCFPVLERLGYALQDAVNGWWVFSHGRHETRIAAVAVTRLQLHAGRQRECCYLLHTIENHANVTKYICEDVAELETILTEFGKNDEPSR